MEYGVYCINEGLIEDNAIREIFQTSILGGIVGQIFYQRVKNNTKTLIFKGKDKQNIINNTDNLNLLCSNLLSDCYFIFEQIKNVE